MSDSQLKITAEHQNNLVTATVNLISVNAATVAYLTVLMKAEPELEVKISDMLGDIRKITLEGIDALNAILPDSERESAAAMFDGFVNLSVENHAQTIELLKMMEAMQKASAA